MIAYLDLATGADSPRTQREHAGVAGPSHRPPDLPEQCSIPLRLTLPPLHLEVVRGDDTGIKAAGVGRLVYDALPRNAVFLSIDLDRQPSLRSYRPPKDALAEFRARLPDVEQATEQRLKAANVGLDEDRRRGADRLIVSLTS